MSRKKIFDILPPQFQDLPSEESALTFKKISSKKTTSEKQNRNRRILIPFFIFLFFLLVGSYFTLAKVKIEIWPKTEILNIEEKITLDINAPQIDFSGKIIPAQLLEIEEVTSQKFPSSGKTEMETPAQGTIQVYNNYHLSQSLVKNTRFQPSLEKVLYFCSKKSIVIPAKSNLGIEVYSCKLGGEVRGGEEYNIGPSTFSIPGLAGLPQYYSIYGKSFSPMEEGFKGEMPIVLKEDLEKAKEELTQTLFTKLEESLKKRVLTDLIFIAKAVEKEIIEIVSDTEIGAEGESFQLQAKGKLKTMVFQKLDLENFAINVILNQVPDNKKIQTESLKIDFSPETIKLEEGKIVLNSQISAKIFFDLDSEILKTSLTGKSFPESKTILENRTDIVKSQISVWPFWSGRLPKETEKIEIEMKINSSLKED